MLAAAKDRAGDLATEILQCHAASTDSEKRDALAEAGFECAAVLRDHLAVGDDRQDMEVWTLHLGRKALRWDSCEYYGGRPVYLAGQHLR